MCLFISLSGTDGRNKREKGRNKEGWGRGGGRKKGIKEGKKKGRGSMNE